MEKVLKVVLIAFLIIVVLGLILAFNIDKSNPTGKVITETEKALYDTTASLKQGEYESRTFGVMEDNVNINLVFSSDNYANIYLIRESEYTRYQDKESFYAIQKGVNSKKFEIDNFPLEQGKYVIIVEAADSDINYYIKLTTK